MNLLRTFVLLSVLGAGWANAQWKLHVEKDKSGRLLDVYWKENDVTVPALESVLLDLVLRHPAILKTRADTAHGAVLLPFNTPEVPEGEVVLLLPGKTATFPTQPFLGQAPIQLELHPKGFFFVRPQGVKVSLEFYSLATGRIQVFPTDLDLDTFGRTSRIELTPREAIVTTGDKRLVFVPGQKQATSNLVYEDLAEGNLKVIEHEFGSRNLTKEAALGTLNPDFTESSRADYLARSLIHGKGQRSVLLWGEDGTNEQGIVHLFAQNVQSGKYPDLKNWRVYEVNWARFNTGGLVDKAVEKADDFMRAVAQKKVILIVPNIQNLVGLGVDTQGSAKGDVSSVFQTYIESGKVLVIATTKSQYMSDVQRRRDFFNAMKSVQVLAPTGKDLQAKLYRYAEAKFQQTGVRFSQDNIDLIVELTNRYLPEVKQPGKTLEAMDALSSQLQKVSDSDEGTTEHETVLISDADIKNYVAFTARIPSIAASTGSTLESFALNKEDFYKGMKELVSNNAAKEALRMALLQIALSEQKQDADGSELGLTALLLVGPSGSGKTFSAEILSKALQRRGIDLPLQPKIDGGTLSDGEQGVRTLIGASPSFVGFSRDGGILYQMIQKHPQSILLFDELDKMHENVNKTLYQFLDEGKITNAAGNTARFTRGLAIFTANWGCVGSGGASVKNDRGVKPEPVCDYIDRWDKHHLFKDEPGLFKEDPLVANWSEADLQYNLFNCLEKEHLLNVQLLGRIGRSNLVILHHFTKKDFVEIAENNLSDLVRRYSKTHKAVVEITDDAKKWIVNLAWGKDGKLGFSVGARSINNVLKSEVGRRLMEFAAINNRTARGKTWLVSVEKVGQVEQIKVEIKTQEKNS